MLTNKYEVLGEDGVVYPMTGTDAEHAARRVADLHRVTVIATRPDQTPTIHVGMGEG